MRHAASREPRDETCQCHTVTTPAWPIIILQSSIPIILTFVTSTFILILVSPLNLTPHFPLPANQSQHSHLLSHSNDTIVHIYQFFYIPSWIYSLDTTDKLPQLNPIPACHLPSPIYDIWQSGRDARYTYIISTFPVIILLIFLSSINTIHPLQLPSF